MTIKEAFNFSGFRDGYDLLFTNMSQAFIQYPTGLQIPEGRPILFEKDRTKIVLIYENILRNYGSLKFDPELLDDLPNKTAANVKNAVFSECWKCEKQINKIFDIESFVDTIGETGLQGTEKTTTKLGKRTANTTTPEATTVTSTTSYDEYTGTNAFKDTGKTKTSVNGTLKTESESVTDTVDVEKIMLLGDKLPDYLRKELELSNYNFIDMYTKIFVNAVSLPIYE